MRILRLVRNRRTAPFIIIYSCYAAAWLLINLITHIAHVALQFSTPLTEFLGTCLLLSGAVYIGVLLGRGADQEAVTNVAPVPLSSKPSIETEYQALKAAFERQMQEAELLDRVRIAISRELDLQTVIRTVVKGVADAFGYTQISLYLLEQDVLVLQYQIGYDHVIERVPITEGVAGRVVRDGEPLLIEDVTQVPEFLGAISGIVSEIAVPLYDGHSVVGLFNVESLSGSKLTKADLALMIALSDHIDIALTRARLYEEMRRNEEIFRQIFTNAPIAMVLSSMDAKVMRVNPATCQLFGYTEQELIGMGLSVVAHPDDDPRNIELRDELLLGNMTYFTMEKRYYAKDQSLIYGILQVALIRDAQGNPAQFVGQIVDVTDLKKAEQNLQSLNQELEQHVLDRTKELSTAYQRLIELDKLKTKFIGDISHELRTPVANINTRLYLIDRDKAERIPDHLAIIKAQIQRLQMLLDDVLNFARVESVDRETVFLEAVNLNTLLEALRPTYLARASAAKLNLICEQQPVPLLIHGSNEQLVKLVTHLLDNAIKYTAAGYVKVRTYASEGRAVIEVSDSGRGILPEDMPHIFERFYRGHNVGSSNIPGTGLGLAIVKEIVTLHDGDIKVESVPEQGTTIHVTLPLASKTSAL